LANGGNSECSEPIVSLGGPLASDDTCGLDAAGDLPETTPLLGPLAETGGATRTHALLLGSPAIDRIPSAVCTVATDQRGVARPPSPGSCDIGAYEFAPAADIAALTKDTVVVLTASATLTKHQGRAVLEPLKQAYISATHGEWAAVCQWLDAFTVTLTGYIPNLGSNVVQPLLDAAARVRATVCHN
jgi:hypothetical protein